jgi:hypothetical protein
MLNTNWFVGQSGHTAEHNAISKRLLDTPTVMDYGAKGDGVTDDTTAIQRALDAAVNGKSLRMPSRVYCISSPLYPRDYLRWEGVRAESETGGALLKWIGVPGGTMVHLRNTYGVNIDGINLNGMNTQNLTGYRIDSNNKPASQRNVIRNFSARHFGNALANIQSQAIHLGDSLKVEPLTQYQSDGVLLENFLIADAHTGIYIDSQNVDYTNFRNFAISAIRYGVYFNRAGFIDVTNGAFGLLMGSGGSFIVIDGPHGCLRFSQIQGEQGNGSFLVVTNSVTTPIPIILESSTFDLPIDIQANRRVISWGNIYNADVTLSGSDTHLMSMFDYFSGAFGFKPIGQNSKVISVDPLQIVVSEYADNTAAIASGLIAGQTYRTGDVLKVVH